MVRVCVQQPQCGECSVVSDSWTVAHRAPLPMEFSRQEYWSGLPCNPGALPDPEIEPESPASPALAGGFFTAMPALTDSEECATFMLGKCTGMFAATRDSSETSGFFQVFFLFYIDFLLSFSAVGYSV